MVRGARGGRGLPGMIGRITASRYDDWDEGT